VFVWIQINFFRAEFVLVLTVYQVFPLVMKTGLGVNFAYVVFWIKEW
jgi:hypothetical protein